MAVIGLGKDFAVLKHADGAADLDGAGFQNFDFVNDGFFGESH